MNKTIIILLSFTLMLSGGIAFAQKKTENDYNLQKAYEVLQEEKDVAKALNLINKQLQETPDDAEALMFRVRLLRDKKDYSQAIQDLNHALKVNKPKKSGIQNSNIYWWKAYIYMDIHDDQKAAENFAMAYKLAQKDDKENLQSIAFGYAQALFLLKDIDGADAIYRQMLKEDEADVVAMVGLARNQIERHQYQQALDLLEKSQRYDADYQEIYRFKLSAYNGLGEEVKAIDAAMDWLEKDSDANFEKILDAALKRPNYAEAQMRARAKKSDYPVIWKGFLTRLYEKQHRYFDAIHMYDEIEKEYGHTNQVNINRSDIYKELGLYDKAIEDITVAIEKEPDWYSLCFRGDYYRLAGMYEKAIEDFSAAIEESPEYAYPYYRRGWCYELKGDKNKALENYNLGIEIQEDEYPYLYLMRGTLLLERGNAKEANADFEKILQTDTLVVDGSCRHYALHFLGRDEEAQEWMEKLMALDPEDAGHHYDQACLYARMGKIAESLESLRISFEKGYRSFAHIEHDDDIDPLRNEPEYKFLIEEYKAKHEAFLRENDIAVPFAEENLTEISFKRHNGGTFEIPCDINGLALQMIFDTGASDVTISSVEANFMFKNGYLSEKDIKGKRYYQIANGQINEGTVITLREVKIGDAVLRNVDASVVKSQKAPLLLGQSAMERFGTITIDNLNNKLIIKH